MSALILHHYPPSPVSEKIRAGFGIKQLDWQSVEENRLPVRPELFAMTGGFRRIPVLQVGADLYCDTQCILREIERRHPSPTFFPDGEGLPYTLSRWSDNEFFDLAVRVAFAPSANELPPELVADRARLYLGANGDFRNELEHLPHTLSQLRAQFGWLEQRLADKGPWLTGSSAGITDLLVWYIVWFVQGRYPDAERFLSEFSNVLEWAEQMRGLGHGTAHDLSTDEALAIARDATPASPIQSDPRDPQGLVAGLSVSISALSDSGETPVRGKLRSISRDTVSLDIVNDACGAVAVHFPRVGYRITPDV